MNEEALVAVIMAGGSGTRFWPLSTADRPKQFLTLFGDRTLLQHSFDRLKGMVAPERTLVLTNQAFLDMVHNQLPEIPERNIIGEPMIRDTAAAVTLGAVICRRLFGNPVMAVLTADHFISPVRRFQEVVRSAARGAKRTEAFYTVGIETRRAATGYGYLETGKRLEPEGNVEHFQLVQFKEKPDQHTAAQYHADERFFWNSGMFVWTVDAILTEVQAHLPKHAEQLFPLEKKFGASDWLQALQEAFNTLPKISIDFGVMEKAGNIRMVKGDFDWDDVGSWLALDRFLTPDPHGNRARGVLHASDAENNLVFCEDPSETVAVLGVRDLAVVRSGERTLVMKRSHAEALKLLVTRMQDSK